jgi:hypothetical protein
MAAAKQVVCVHPFAVTLDDGDVQVHEGDVYTSKHPVVKGREHLFAPRSDHNVTAAPPPRSRARQS